MTHTKPNLQSSLAILQQSEYDLRIFTKWWNRRTAERVSSENIEPDRWTTKLKCLKLLAQTLFFLPIPVRFKIGLYILSIPQQMVSRYILLRAKKKLTKAQKNGLQVVALAGSYGKTSTKKWLSHLLKSQISVLETDKSINTPLGIANTIIRQLTPHHSVFIVELGEYYQGDIAELAAFIEPDFGVITPIGHQHLERMKSIDIISQTIGELLSYFEAKHTHSNQKLKSNLKQPRTVKQKHTLPVISAIENTPYFKDRTQYYGPNKNSQKAKWSVVTKEISKAGTEATVSSPTTSWDIFTPLYGEHQVSNALPAFWLAQQLTTTHTHANISLEKIAKQAASMPYIPQRHEPHFAANDVLILDNSYNTNPESFSASLKLIEDLKPTRSFVITLGFVELGDQALEMHTQLGKNIAKKIDYLGLIDSDQAQTITKAFIQAGGKATHVSINKTPELCMSDLQSKVIPGSVILFEGGYREVLV